MVPSSSRDAERRPSGTHSHSVFEVAVEVEVKPFYRAFRLQMVGRCQGVLHMAEAGKITGGGGWVSAGVSAAGGGGAGGHLWPTCFPDIIAVSLALLRQLTAVTSCWE